jgi:hypothetical protein
MTNKTDKNSNETRSRAPSKIDERASTDSNPKGQNPPQAELFDPIIVTYTRKQALADGVQVEATKLALQAGFTIPVFLTAGVHGQYVKVPEGVTGQDETGRLWDILWMLRYAIRKARSGARRIRFELYVRNSDSNPAALVFLYAEVGGVDFDDFRPCITVMLPDED